MIGSRPCCPCLLAMLPGLALVNGNGNSGVVVATPLGAEAPSSAGGGFSLQWPTGGAISPMDTSMQGHRRASPGPAMSLRYSTLLKAFPVDARHIASDLFYHGPSSLFTICSVLDGHRRTRRAPFAQSLL